MSWIPWTELKAMLLVFVIGGMGVIVIDVVSDYMQAKKMSEGTTISQIIKWKVNQYEEYYLGSDNAGL